MVFQIRDRQACGGEAREFRELVNQRFQALHFALNEASTLRRQFFKISGSCSWPGYCGAA